MQIVNSFDCKQDSFEKITYKKRLIIKSRHKTKFDMYPKLVLKYIIKYLENNDYFCGSRTLILT